MEEEAQEGVHERIGQPHDPALLLPGRERFFKKWKKRRRREYMNELANLMSEVGVDSEERKQRIGELQAKYRELLLTPYREEKESIFGPELQPPNDLNH